MRIDLEWAANSGEPFIDFTNINEDANDEREAIVDFATCRSVIYGLNSIATENNSDNSDLSDISEFSGLL